MTVTALEPGDDASGDLENEVTLTLLSQPIMLQDSEVEMQA